MDFMQVVKDLTPLIATLAAIRPEISNLINHFFKRGKVEVVRSSEIQIGFAENGPNVVISGSILATQRSGLLKRGRLEVERLSDSAKLTMDWKYFGNGELARMINLPKDEVVPFVICFIDSKIHQKLSSIVGNTRQVFRYKIIDKRNELIQNHSKQGKIISSDDALMSVYGDFLERFKQSQEFRSAFNTINNSLFWIPGEYKVSFIGSTKTSSQDFNTTWYFELDQIDYEMMAHNVIRVCQFMTDQPFNHPENIATKLLKDTQAEVKQIGTSSF